MIRDVRAGGTGCQNNALKNVSLQSDPCLNIRYLSITRTDPITSCGRRMGAGAVTPWSRTGGVLIQSMLSLILSMNGFQMICDNLLPQPRETVNEK